MICSKNISENLYSCCRELPDVYVESVLNSTNNTSKLFKTKRLVTFMFFYYCRSGRQLLLNLTVRGPKKSTFIGLFKVKQF